MGRTFHLTGLGGIGMLMSFLCMLGWYIDANTAGTIGIVFGGVFQTFSFVLSLWAFGVLLLTFNPDTNAGPLARLDGSATKDRKRFFLVAYALLLLLAFLSLFSFVPACRTVWGQHVCPAPNWKKLGPLMSFGSVWVYTVLFFSLFSHYEASGAKDAV